MPCAIYVTVKALGISKRDIEHAVQVALHLVKQPNAEISVHCIGDRRMTTLNRIHRQVVGTTDVLSFPIQEDGVWAGGNTDWGDIFVSVPQIHRQAKQHHISYKEEFIRMLAHGVLHLFGHDHAKPTEAALMYGLQEQVVKKLI